MPEASYVHQASACATPGTVWSSLQDPAVWQIVAGVESTSHHAHDGDTLQSFRFTTSIGGVGYQGEARVTAADTGERMTLSIRSNQVTGEITVILTGGHVGTRLTVEMQIRPAGMVGSMLFPVVTGAVSRGFEESVERLAKAMG